MSFASSWNALGVPSTRIPIDGATFISHVLPPVVFYIASAVLAVTPQMHTVRVALWPLIALLALRAVLSVDMSYGKPEWSSLDTLLALFMFSSATRSLGWTFAKGPFVRHLRPQNSSPSTIMDALDLISSYRGYGWDWSRRLYIPHETRPTNRIAFALHASLSAVAHAFICVGFYLAALTMLPLGVGDVPGGSTLFDETLPFWLRLPSSMHHFSSHRLRNLRLHADWPPAFDSPWRATSLSDFWGRRWHQFLRQVFLLVGGYPLSLVLGRDGIIIGAFLASALWHHIIVLTLGGRQAEYWWMFVGFGMMGPGILAEQAFRRVTGRRVGWGGRVDLDDGVAYRVG
ncbi:hypothetical protein EV363DRAFT_1582292 [Boletus edulis]|nr:hypothetical protein EV363DRAFT_1582292 [Boletus edulis]